MYSTRERNNLSDTEKLHLIFRVRSGESLESVAESVGVSYQTLSRWLRIDSQVDGDKVFSALGNNYASGINHWRKIAPSIEKKILKISLKNPRWGAQKIAEQLGREESGKLLVSSHGVHRVLAKHGLSRKENRAEYFEKNGTSLVPTPNRNVKIEMIKAVEAGETISSVCMRFGVSRPTFYKWHRRWKEASDEERDASLSDKRPSADKHWRFLPQARESVLDVILRNPEENLEGIVKRLPKKADGTPLVSRSGVYGVLAERGLNTLEARKDWTRQQREIEGVPAVRPVTSWLERLKQVFEQFLPTRAPAPPPPGVPPLLQAPSGAWLRRFQRLAPYLFFLLLVTFGFFEWGRFLSTAQTPIQAAGYLFASIALATGSVFFLYSLKYYFTLAVVLSFSREETERPGSTSSTSRASRTGWLGRLFGLTSGESAGATPEVRVSSGGLEPDLAQVELERKPFISVQIPMFNEKQVAERILKACTSFDYENYEIVIADDSTDETTTIVRQFAEQWNGQTLKRSDLMSKMSRSDLVAPRIKVIHRKNREGFKGGALKEALKHTDTRAEFIVVFDADFVPYPDTLELFLKYFQVNTSQELGASAQGKQGGLRNYQDSKIAAIQGYQWHVLNKSENWITRGVRSEYAGSYVIERSGEELYGGLKQIAGSVYMIRRDLLDRFNWGTSLTEDFELTLKLYEQGYKVIYTPYIQAPAECASTLNRLIRQRMRWAEGHSMNIRKMFGRMLTTSKINLSEKLEFLYLSPYYLQAAFFIIGTICWVLSETLFQSKLPFWTAIWGWSLVLTNLLSLPLMNSVGLFLEEAEERDYVGTASFVLLSYLLAPFQAYASVKGFLESEEGPWFRTPKTGRITDIFKRGRFYRFIRGIFPGRSAPAPISTEANRFSLNTAFTTANNQFNSFQIQPRRRRWLGNAVFGLFIGLTGLLVAFSPLISLTSASDVSPRLGSIGAALAQEEGQSEEKVIEINTPQAVRFAYQNGQALEMIFHQEPRVRIKIGQQELEITTLEVEGVGKARPQRSLLVGKSQVRYEEIVPDIDLVYKLSRRGFEEQFIIKKAKAITAVSQRLVLKEVEAIEVDGVYGFFDQDNREIFKFSEPYLFEQENREEENREIKFNLEKEVVGYRLSKRLLPEAASWLADPTRVYPVVLDPSVIISTGIADADVDFGGNQQKLVLVSSAYYAFNNDGGRIFYQKCTDLTDHCDQGTDWGSAVYMGDGGDSDNEGPDVFVDGTTIWVAWFDNSTDNINFQSINTASSDAQGSSVCSSPDMGSVSDADTVSIAVGTNGDFFVAYDDDPDIYEVTNVDINCSLTETFTSITSGSGLDGNSRQSLVVAGNTIHIVWEGSGGSGGLRHNYFDVSTSSWGTEVAIDSANSAKTFGLTKNNDADLWLHTIDGSTATALWSCATTCTGGGRSWSEEGTAPFSSQTNVLYATISHATSENDLVLSVIMDTSEQAYFKTTDSETISYSGQESYAFTAGDLGHIASMKTTTNIADAGVVLRQGTNYEFAVVPEKTLLLLFLAPLLPRVLKNMRERRKAWKVV